MSARQCPIEAVPSERAIRVLVALSDNLAGWLNDYGSIIPGWHFRSAVCEQQPKAVSVSRPPLAFLFQHPIALIFAEPKWRGAYAILIGAVNTPMHRNVYGSSEFVGGKMSLG